MFLAKYVPDPLKWIWLLPEVLSNYILSLNSKKRRRNCFLMGVSCISSSLWSPSFFQERLVRTEWKIGGSLLHWTHSVALVPPQTPSWGLLQLLVRVVSEKMADSMHQILKGMTTQMRVTTISYGWWCSAKTLCIRPQDIITTLVQRWQNQHLRLQILCEIVFLPQPCFTNKQLTFWVNLPETIFSWGNIRWKHLQNAWNPTIPRQIFVFS